MTLLDIIKKLDLEIVGGLEAPSLTCVSDVYIGDLLSLAMAKVKSQDIWITIQTHMNIIAVAELVELSAIIIAEDMEIDPDTIEKANELNIPLLRSHLSAYKLASKLNSIGI